MHKIAFAPEARDDLKELYLFIVERADGDRAMAYVERIETYCRGFANFPERGMRRDDLFPGLRGSRFRAQGDPRFPCRGGYGDVPQNSLWWP